ncbi:MAG: hypothetical protein IKX79_03325 [Desulfovibrionaceae bacterium]|nr:hypothetical protein [Desulfovibrionaceae bacterium]
MKRFVCLAALLLLLQGCADMNFSNPFEQKPAETSVNDVFYDEFPDVPFPADMQVDRKKSMVVATPDGIKIGVLTAEGRVDKLSLTTATIHNMQKKGWTLRGMVHGSRSMQVFEKEGRYAVCCFYEQVLSSVMEVWVVTRIADGVISTPNYQSYSSDTSSSAPLPAPSSSSSGSSRSLQQ